jgi:hypothetical protein
VTRRAKTKRKRVAKKRVWYCVPTLDGQDCYVSKADADMRARRISESIGEKWPVKKKRAAKNPSHRRYR